MISPEHYAELLDCLRDFYGIEKGYLFYVDATKLKVVAVSTRKIQFMYSSLAPAVKVKFPDENGLDKYAYLDDLHVDPAKAADKLKVVMSTMVAKNLKELYRL